MTGPLSELTVAVVGLGPMGRGIARCFDAAGAAVLVVDITPTATAAGLDKIEQEAAADGQTLSRLCPSDLGMAVPSADLIVEATVEDLDVKKQLLSSIAMLGRPGLIVASNTSSLSIGEMGRAFGDPARLVGMHFFNPPTKMRLVEVIAAAGTSPATVQKAKEWVAALGKTAVVCGDSPNFIVNRVCRPLYYEAELLVSEGAEPAAVDAAASGALGHPMGPITLLDFTGLHTHLASSETALREFGDPRYRPIPVVRTLVRGGMTGRAAGRGFYDYGTEKPRAAVERVTRVPDTLAAGSAAPTAAGPDADRLKGILTPAYPGSESASGAVSVIVYRCDGPPSAATISELTELAGVGDVVLDSADGQWLEVLPIGVGWLRLHRAPNGSVFAEVVRDDVAGVSVPAFVGGLLDALGARSVEVPALPGLVVERLAHCMINEASTLVQEGLAEPADVDTALRLGMNHPRGPFEQLETDGPGTVYTSLRSMASVSGDPRYRPTPLLRRQAAAAVRG